MGEHNCYLMRGAMGNCAPRYGGARCAVYVRLGGKLLVVVTVLPGMGEHDVPSTCVWEVGTEREVTALRDRTALREGTAAPTLY